MELKALPVEVVRVWVGKYNAGMSVLTNYSAQPVEFDLTDTTNGSATFYNFGSDWINLSDNASNIDWSRSLDLNPLTYSSPLPASEGAPKPVVEVSATFSGALSLAAVAYLNQQLVNAMDLKPVVFKIISQTSSTYLTMEFGSATDPVSLPVGVTMYEDALNAALNLAKEDPESELTAEWALKESTVTYTCNV
jgi:hypothetical protein